MPRQYWHHTCGVTRALIPTPVCGFCGVEGELIGWGLGKHESMGCYQYVYGLKPFGPHRELADELLGDLRVPCSACRREGIVTVDEGESWRICHECEGTGGFWNRTPEEVDAARRKILTVYPEAAASPLPGFIHVELLVDLRKGEMVAARDDQGGTLQELEDDFEDDLEDDFEGDSWKQVSLAGFAKALDDALVVDPEARPPSGCVLVPRAALSVRSAFLLAIADEEARKEAADEECPELWATLARLACPRWVIHCEVTDSMVSGDWGLMEFTLGHRGYLYNQPDYGIGDDESLPILAAWEPADDEAARRACILSVYAREWDKRGWPPCSGEWAAADRDLLFDAIVNALVSDPDWAWFLVERLQRHVGVAHDTVLAAAKQCAVPVEEVASFLETIPQLRREPSEALAADERKILVALFVQAVEGAG